MKAILIVGDGMADRPIKELEYRTPLEVANKPSLNQIAETGICGIIDPIAPGVPPGSDTATLSLLGYEAAKVYSGRGALEALGSGVKVLSGDVAFRCNFATINKGSVVLDRRAGRIANDDAAILVRSLQRIKVGRFPIRFQFKNTVQHRAVLVIRGRGVSAAVSESDPEEAGKKVLKIKPLEKSQEARFTATFLNELTWRFHEVLEKHPINEARAKRGLPPANIILSRGAGTVPNIRTLQEIFGIKSACIAAVSLIKGVCKAAGMKIAYVKGATGTPQTDYTAKARTTVQALKNSDFVFLHVKATDVASHDGRPMQKVEVIEKIDAMLGYLLDNVDLDSTYLAVTADHTTSTVTGVHEGDPVPIAITGPYVRRDDVREFTERACAKGGLNRTRGMDLMPTLMNLIGKANKFGA